MAIKDAAVVVDWVFSSPAVRARSTAEITLHSAGIKLPVFEDERLHEQHVGSWFGRVASDTFDQACLAQIAQCGKDFRPPEGESMNDVGDRMLDWLHNLPEVLGRSEGVVFGFTHGGAIRALVSTLNDWSHAQTYAASPANTSVTLLRLNESGEWDTEFVAVDALDAFSVAAKGETVQPSACGALDFGEVTS